MSVIPFLRTPLGGIAPLPVARFLGVVHTAGRDVTVPWTVAKPHPNQRIVVAIAHVRRSIFFHNLQLLNLGGAAMNLRAFHRASYSITGGGTYHAGLWLADATPGNEAAFNVRAAFSEEGTERFVRMAAWQLDFAKGSVFHSSASRIIGPSQVGQGENPSDNDAGLLPAFKGISIHAAIGSRYSFAPDFESLTPTTIGSAFTYADNHDTYAAKAVRTYPARLTRPVAALWTSSLSLSVVIGCSYESA